MSLKYYILYWLYKLQISKTQGFSARSSNDFDRDYALSLLEKNPILTFRASPKEVIDELELLYADLEGYSDRFREEFSAMNEFMALYPKKAKPRLRNILHDLIVKPVILNDFEYLNVVYPQSKIIDFMDENKELSYVYFVISTLCRRHEWDEINVFWSNNKIQKPSCIYAEIHFLIILIKMFYLKPEWGLMRVRLEDLSNILSDNTNTIPNEIYIKYEMFVDTFYQLCWLEIKIGCGDSCHFGWDKVREIKNTQFVDIDNDLKYYLENSVLEKEWLYREYEELIERYNKSLARERE